MFTRTFWKKTLERATKSAAQAGILAIGMTEAFNLFALNWQNFAGIAAGGAFLSVLTSLSSEPFGPDDSPSVV